MAIDLPNVISSGMCVGCGACAVAVPASLKMELSRLGTYLPVTHDGSSVSDLENEVLAKASAVCPFSAEARNDDSIGLELFGTSNPEHHPAVGFHRKIVAGHVVGDDFRDGGTSGGMTSWALSRLLEEGHVDAVVHVASTLSRDQPLSRYTISRSVQELLNGRKSRYHVQSLDEVMMEIKRIPGRYAIVGVPCFIKAVRLLADNDETIRDRVVFCASLFCGHLKSTLYSDYLAGSVGIEPTEVSDIDYRHKKPGRPPNRYCAKVSPFEGDAVVRGAEQIPMANWGIGLFKLGACDYCDDITGETADISFGDAWLPPFMSDWKGANVAVARSPIAVQILTGGETSGALAVSPWTDEKVAESQAGAFRHRRSGLSVRLGNRRANGEWTPNKRVVPLAESELETPFAQRMLNREAIAVASGPSYLQSLEHGDLNTFIEDMKPYIEKYDGSRSSTIFRRSATWLTLRLPTRAESGLRRIARWLRLT